MRWPFRPRDKSCDVRVFNHPRTGEITLRLKGFVGWPSKWETPILQLDVNLEAPIERDVAEQLQDQLQRLLNNGTQP